MPQVGTLYRSFRNQAKDSRDNANPLAGRISRVIAQGSSQSGNFVKSFIQLGFNQDEANQIVWDGADAHIAGRQLALNIRFATPGNTRETGSESTLWWGDYTDTIRGHQKKSSMLDRCRATRTCQKIFDTFGATEFWSLRMSPNLVGTGADIDIPFGAGGPKILLSGHETRWRRRRLRDRRPTRAQRVRTA
jgi:hypothetical protein